MDFKHAIANNRTSSKDTFEARKIYSDIFQNKGIPTIDLWNEKPFYGKVDGSGYSVSLLEQSTLKQLTIKEPMFCVDFVADAFKDFSRFLLNNAKNSAILANNRTPVKAWESFKLTYSLFLEGKMKYFVESYLPDFRNDIRNFQDFIKIFFKFLEDTKPLVFTRSSYIKSSLCSVYVTGLVIDLSKTEKDKDIQKEKLFLDPDFGFYLNTARKFGFYVDKNIPWRLVANLSSPKLQSYMEPYGITYKPNTESDFFSKYHNYTFVYELEDLRRFLFDSYSRFVSMFTDTITQVNQEGKKIIHIVPKETLTELPNDKLFWLNLYLKVLLKDMDINLNERDFQRIIDKATFNPDLLTEQNLFLIHQQIKNI
jgi:hypothetical protein